MPKQLVLASQVVLHKPILCNLPYQSKTLLSHWYTLRQLTAQNVQSYRKHNIQPSEIISGSTRLLTAQPVTNLTGTPWCARYFSTKTVTNKLPNTDVGKYSNRTNIAWGYCLVLSYEYNQQSSTVTRSYLFLSLQDYHQVSTDWETGKLSQAPQHLKALANQGS